MLAASVKASFAEPLAVHIVSQVIFSCAATFAWRVEHSVVAGFGNNKKLLGIGGEYLAAIMAH